MRHKPLQIILALAVAAVAATLAISCSNRDKEVEIKELLQTIEEQSQPLYQQMALTQWNAAVSGKADENCGQAFVCPYDIRRLFQCAGQIPQQFRQTAAKRLRQQERKPDDGNCAKKIK